MVNGERTTNEANNEAINVTAHNTAHSTTNGTSFEKATAEAHAQYRSAQEFKSFTDRSAALFEDNLNSKPTAGFNINEEDTTNHGVVEALFAAAMIHTEWYDANRQPCPAGSTDEMLALSKTIIQDIADRALTKEAFLINISALAGGSFMYKSATRTVTRAEVGLDYTKYRITWDLRYGSISGDFSMYQTVPHSLWKTDKKPEEPPLPYEPPTDPAAAAVYWQKKYDKVVANTKIGAVNQLLALF